MIEIFSSIMGLTPKIVNYETMSQELTINCNLLNKFYLKNSVHLLHLLDKNE